MEATGRIQDAWRVIHGAADGAPDGLTVDRYSDWLLLSVSAQIADPCARSWADAARSELPARGIVVKQRTRRSSAAPESWVIGEPPPRPLLVREEDARFSSDLLDGLATGIYLDQHDTRLAIRAYARGVDVLNLFSYTCTFSVHAALAGAARVTSVDASQKALRRGRENMVASGLNCDAHRWFQDDVKDHVLRSRRGRRRYGLVILDAPAFGRAGKSVHQLERDLPWLLEHTMAITHVGGVLCVSVHDPAISTRSLKSLADIAGRNVGRHVEFLEERGLPEWDHPTPKARVDKGADEQGAYLKTLVLKVG